MKARVVRFFVLSLMLTAWVCRGQETHRHDMSAGFGQVNFPISCSAAAQKQFNQALAILHSFEYPEAEKAFVAIGSGEPTCAMAFWGVAMSNYHPLWAPPTSDQLARGASAIERARSLDAKTQRERDYINALGNFYRDADKSDHRTRARAYAQSINQIYIRYPQDNEAAIFYALALNERALVVTEAQYVENKKLAGEILNKVLPKEPNHPGIAHYLIHSYDVPELAYLALPAARSYAKIAPASPHAQHMPSHIFTRLGLWQESIQSNLASAATAQAIVAKSHPGWAAQDQLHALDYLVYAYLQGAQDKKAKSILDQANALSRVDQEVFQAAYAWSAMPARYALERHQWREAVALTPHPDAFPWKQFPFAEANLHFARAVGAARSNDPSSARLEIDELSRIQQSLSEIKIGYDWATQVEIQRLAASAWLNRLEGKTDEALTLMRRAADREDATEKHPVTPGAILPAREMLGDLLLDANQPAAALLEYEVELKQAPNRFNSLYGAAKAAELSGDISKAKDYYDKLVKLCAQSDSVRPELQNARKYLASRRLN